MRKLPHGCVKVLNEATSRLLNGAYISARVGTIIAARYAGVMLITRITLRKYFYRAAWEMVILGPKSLTQYLCQVHDSCLCARVITSKGPPKN